MSLEPTKIWKLHMWGNDLSWRAVRSLSRTTWDHLTVIDLSENGDRQRD